MTQNEQTKALQPWKSYNGKDWMIGWTPPHMMVGPWPDRTGWSMAYTATTGFCNLDLHDYEDEDLALALTGQALFLVSDGVPIKTVLREFAKIKVWREMKIKLTTPGDHWAFHPNVGYQRLNTYADDNRIN